MRGLGLLRPEIGLSAYVSLACITGLACEYLDRIGRCDCLRGCRVPGRGGTGWVADGSWVVFEAVVTDEAP